MAPFNIRSLSAAAVLTALAASAQAQGVVNALDVSGRHSFRG